MKHRDTRDIVGGLVLIVLGLFAAFYAQRYSFGELSRMGPGFFPVVLGILLAVLGVLVALPAMLRAGEPLHVEWKTAGLVIASIVVFALALPVLGLLLATILAVLINSMADRQITWKGRFMLSVSVAVIVYLVFGYGLGMTLPIFPWD
jgi:hypothetical protein